MTYGYSATMRTRPGRRDDVVELLLRDQSALIGLGCRSYLVGVNDEHPDMIYVSEVWDSREAHDASLQLPAVKAAIAEAMPMLTGEHTGHGYTIVGGLGA